MEGLPVDEYAREREAMIELILRRGVSDRRVLSAMREVPRHLFVPHASSMQAYGDHPLPIGGGQTISQPYVVAAMTEAARVLPGERVLEIGTGSGYQAAVLAALGAEVFSVERIPEHVERARECLRAARVPDVALRAGDGFDGWPEHAPYAAILVTAAAPRVPEPLWSQLAEGGRLVIPLGLPNDVQRLEVHVKRGDAARVEPLFPVRFVPMLGLVQQGRAE